jgi:membrane protease YdiL (CAAX protease family)
VIPVAIVVVALVEVVAWRLVATGRASVWRLLVAVFALQAVVAVAIGGFSGPGDRGPWLAADLGLAAGAALFVATRLFVGIAVDWEPFRRHVGDGFGLAREVSLATALILSLGVAVTGEELFWRGLVQDRLAKATSPGVGALLTWGGYVVTNLSSVSMPIIAAAIVGGATWTALAWYTGGILASLICHAIWTGMMLAFPPAAGRGMMPA